MIATEEENIDIIKLLLSNPNIDVNMKSIFFFNFHGIFNFFLIQLLILN